MKLKYNRPNVYTAAGVRLMPGMNEITEKQAAALATCKGFHDRIKKEVIEIKSGSLPEGGAQPTEPDGGAETESVAPSNSDANKTGKQLIDEIKETYDRDRLLELQQDERTTVAEAATKQLAKIDEAGQE